MQVVSFFPGVALESWIISSFYVRYVHAYTISQEMYIQKKHQDDEDHRTPTPARDPYADDAKPKRNMAVFLRNAVHVAIRG